MLHNLATYVYKRANEEFNKMIIVEISTASKFVVKEDVFAGSYSN